MSVLLKLLNPKWFILSTGVVRGIGLQHIGAYVNLGAYYLVCIPVALSFAFALHFKGQGLWSGLVAGAAVQCVALSLVTAFTRWEHKVLKFFNFLKKKKKYQEINVGWTGFCRRWKQGKGYSQRNFQLEMIRYASMKNWWRYCERNFLPNTDFGSKFKCYLFPGNEVRGNILSQISCVFVSITFFYSLLLFFYLLISIFLQRNIASIQWYNKFRLISFLLIFMLF